MKKLLKLLGKVLLALYICRIFAGPIVYQIRREKEIEEAQNIEIKHSWNPIKPQDLTQKKSEIEGLSMQDCIDMGIPGNATADTDMDGLTDKEEVETYHTDPTKSSTSGDLYTDGYKVEHKMDLFAYYEYEGEFTFSQNECEEVLLAASDAINQYAEIRDFSKVYEIDGYNNMAVYDVRSYNGKIQINAKNILKENHCRSSKVIPCISVEYGSDFILPEFSEEEGVISLDYDFEADTCYTVFLLKQKGFIAPTIMEDSFCQVTGNACVSFGSPLLSELYDMDFVTLYNNEDSVPVIEDVMSDYISEDQLDEKNFIKTNSTGIKIAIKFLRTFFPDFELRTGNERIWHLLFCFVEQDNMYTMFFVNNDMSSKVYEKVQEEKTYKTAFDIRKDTFAFANINTDISPNGTCAGITHFTTYLYNIGESKATGTYTDSNEEKKTWDITKDKENQTLLDRGLRDYILTQEQLDSHSENGIISLQNTELQDYERELIQMLVGMWEEANANPKVQDFVRTYKDFYPAEMRDFLLQELKQGNVVDAYIRLENMTHAIVIYGYERNYYFPDFVNFYVYDCNYSINTEEGTTNIDKFVLRTWTFRDTLRYRYSPFGIFSDYVGKTWIGKEGSFGLLLLDENWDMIYEGN